MRDQESKPLDKGVFVHLGNITCIEKASKDHSRIHLVSGQSLLVGLPFDELEEKVSRLWL